MTAPAEQEPLERPEPAEPNLIVLGAEDAPTCTDGVCSW